MNHQKKGLTKRGLSTLFSSNKPGFIYTDIRCVKEIVRRLQKI
jgi:hypothetical protein